MHTSYQSTLIEQSVYCLKVWMFLSQCCCFLLLQIMTFLLLFYEAIYTFIPSFWITFFIVFGEGLLGGGTYANAFYQLSSSVSEICVWIYLIQCSVRPCVCCVLIWIIKVSWFQGSKCVYNVTMYQWHIYMWFNTHTGIRWVQRVCNGCDHCGWHYWGHTGWNQLYTPTQLHLWSCCG